MIKTYHPMGFIRRLPEASLMILAFSVFLLSCKVYQPTYYFKDIKRDTVITGFVNNNLELKIQKNDILNITVSSLNPIEDNLYNSSATALEATKGFTVSLDGNIYIHRLGKFQVEGLTRQEVKNKLEKELSPYLKDPIANVNFANHRVTVFGETTSKVIEMPEERISLVEVMANAGAVTLNSRLDELMVIRETGNKKEFKHLNLEDPSIFTSPWYYLQPNDIVVVKPNEEKIDAEQRRTRNQLLYTTVLSGITFVFLIIDRLFR